MTSLSSADLVMLAVVLLSSFIGMWRGLVKEILSLIVWFAALITAYSFSHKAAEKIDLAIIFGPQVGDVADQVAGFLAIFIGVLLVGGLIQYLISKAIQITALSSVDRLLGIVFGAVRGLVLLLVGLIALEPYQVGSEWWEASVIRGPLLEYKDDAISAFQSMSSVAATSMEKEGA